MIQSFYSGKPTYHLKKAGRNLKKNHTKRKVLIRGAAFLVTIVFLLTLRANFGEQVSDTASIIAVFFHMGSFAKDLFD